MIQANELRIGNYVYWDIPQKKDVPHVVKGILEYTLHTVPISICEFKEYKSIPLTEQWLIDFGFEKHEKGFVSYQFTIGENPLTHDHEFEIVWILELDHKLNRKLELYPFYRNGHHLIKSVHQLQNLFYSLTGKELTLTK